MSDFEVNVNTNLDTSEAESKLDVLTKEKRTVYKKIYRVTKSIEKSHSNKYLPKCGKNMQIVKIQ